MTKLSFSIVMVDVGGMTSQCAYAEQGQSELIILVDVFVHRSASAIYRL